jgi:hypothetical protein
VRLHIYALSSEANAFSFQAQTLFDGMIAAQLDVAACA